MWTPPVSNFKVTRARPGETIAGRLNAANFPNGAYAGQIVAIDPASLAGAPAEGATINAGPFNAATNATGLVFATGVKGYHLDRHVIVAEGLPLEFFLFGYSFQTPELIGTWGLYDPATATPQQKIGYASAREVLECEVEGVDYLVISQGANDATVGKIDPATLAVNALLGTAGGKLRIAQPTDEPMYRVRGFLQPTIVPNNTFRLLLENVTA